MATRQPFEAARRILLSDLVESIPEGGYVNVPVRKGKQYRDLVWSAADSLGIDPPDYFDGIIQVNRVDNQYGLVVSYPVSPTVFRTLGIGYRDVDSDEPDILLMSIEHDFETNSFQLFRGSKRTCPVSYLPRVSFHPDQVGNSWVLDHLRDNGLPCLSKHLSKYGHLWVPVPGIRYELEPLVPKDVQEELRSCIDGKAFSRRGNNFTVYVYFDKEAPYPLGAVSYRNDRSVHYYFDPDSMKFIASFSRDLSSKMVIKSTRAPIPLDLFYHESAIPKKKSRNVYAQHPELKHQYEALQSFIESNLPDIENDMADGKTLKGIFQDTFIMPDGFQNDLAGLDSFVRRFLMNTVTYVSGIEIPAKINLVPDEGNILVELEIEFATDRGTKRKSFPIMRYGPRIEESCIIHYPKITTRKKLVK